MSDVKVWDAPRIGRETPMLIERMCYQRVVLEADYAQAMREAEDRELAVLRNNEAMRLVASEALKLHQTGVRQLSMGAEVQVTVYLREWQAVADALAKISQNRCSVTVPAALPKGDR